MDDAGATVKNMIFQHVKSKKCVIKGAKDFAEYANQINGTFCFYLAENEIMTEPQEIKNSRNIKNSCFKNLMKIMFVKWSFTSLVTKQTHFTFSGTAKRATRKFAGTISFHWAMRLIRRAATAKKDIKEMKSTSNVNCETNRFIKLVLKSNQHLSRSYSLFCSKVFMFI